jgi:hypothetical protein
MLLLVMSQYQHRLSSITIFSPVGSANRIAVFISNQIIKKYENYRLFHKALSERG